MKYIVICSAVLFSTVCVTPVFAEEKVFFSTMFNDFRSSGIEGALERKKIRQWYSENKEKLVIVDNQATLGCKIIPMKNVNGTHSYDHNTCTFEAELISRPCKSKNLNQGNKLA